jgi:hypothetical protein
MDSDLVFPLNTQFRVIQSYQYLSTHNALVGYSQASYDIIMLNCKGTLRAKS